MLVYQRVTQPRVKDGLPRSNGAIRCPVRIGAVAVASTFAMLRWFGNVFNQTIYGFMEYLWKNLWIYGFMLDTHYIVDSRCLRLQNASNAILVAELGVGFPLGLSHKGTTKMRRNAGLPCYGNVVLYFANCKVHDLPIPVHYCKPVLL